jgi:hypothetical protein
MLLLLSDGKRIVWTSTRDHPELPIGTNSDPADYPQGAELYTSNIDGSDVRRHPQHRLRCRGLGVARRPVGAVRPTDRRQDGLVENPAGRDGGGADHRLEGWEPGGCFYLADNRTIIFRAWRTIDQRRKTACRCQSSPSVTTAQGCAA